MSALSAEIGEQIARLRVLWPVLNSRPEHTQEIESALARHARRITADDVAHGFSDAIEASPTTGWPPGPHEVLGCVMARAHSRGVTTRTTTSRYAAGMTFGEWWATVPAIERPHHAALHKMMTKEEITVPATPMPDEIEWEDAA